MEPPDDAPWKDVLVAAIRQDRVSTLETKMQKDGFDVNSTYWTDNGYGVDVAFTPLSCAVELNAVRCVNYLRDMGAHPYQPVFNYSEETVQWPGYKALEKALDEDENNLAFEYGVAQDMWVKFASEKYGMSQATCRALKDQANEQGVELVQLIYPMGTSQWIMVISPQEGHIGRLGVWSEEDTDYTLGLFATVEFSPMQRAVLVHGRDSEIARLVRGDSPVRITKTYKVGFDAWRHHNKGQRAKTDGTLFFLLKGLNKFNIPGELRERIADLALF